MCWADLQFELYCSGPTGNIRLLGISEGSPPRAGLLSVTCPNSNRLARRGVFVFLYRRLFDCT
jgi:hypothetical protein